MTVEEAKEFLRENGYFMGNLWRVEDVQSKFDCTDEEAQEVLERAMDAEGTYEAIWFNIDYYGEEDNLTPIKNPQENEGS